MREACSHTCSHPNQPTNTHRHHPTHHPHTPGDHGSTFAGNPLVCATACAVFDKIAAPSFLEGVTAKGERLRAGLREVLKGNAHVKEVSFVLLGGAGAEGVG